MKLINLISYLTLVIAFGLLFVFAYWKFYSYQPIKINFADSRKVLLIEKKTLRIGDELVYYVNYTKNINVNPTISKFYVDSLIYPVTNSPGLNHPIGKGRDRIVMEIPKGLPLNEKLKLVINYNYRVNPIRTIDIQVETEEFTLIK